MTKDAREDGAEAGPDASAPLPNALDAFSLETQSRGQVDAPAEAPSADAETYAAVEQDDGEGEGEGEVLATTKIRRSLNLRPRSMRRKSTRT